MTTGTEEFGPDESGTRSPAGAPGPEAAPWLAGGSVGYAEAMFGSGPQEADAGARGPSGGRRRAAEPGEGPGATFFDRPGFEQPGPAGRSGGFAPGGSQGPGFDAPTAEFYPGPLFDQPGFEQHGFDQPSFDQPAFDQPPFEPQPFEPHSFEPQSFDQSGYDPRGSESVGGRLGGRGPGETPGPQGPPQPLRSSAPVAPAEAGTPMGAAQDRGAWTAAPAPRPVRREPAPQAEGVTPLRVAPSQTIPHVGQPQAVHPQGMPSPALPPQAAPAQTAPPQAAPPQYAAAPMPPRPSVPDEPVPAPEPLPMRSQRDADRSGSHPRPGATRGPAAGQPDPLAASGSAMPGPAVPVTAPRAAAVTHETLTPPRRPAAPQAQAPARPRTLQHAPDAAPMGGVGTDTVTAAPASPVESRATPGGEELSRERLRSVAPVPAPREASAAVDARRGGFSTLVAPPGPDTAAVERPEIVAEDLTDADELVVPWQALATPVGLAESRSAMPAAPPLPPPAPAPVQTPPPAIVPEHEAQPQEPGADQTVVPQTPPAAPADATAGAVRPLTVPAPRGARRRSDEAGAAPEPAAPHSAATPGGAADQDRAPAYDREALEAVYRVIHERRDVRNDFLPDEVPVDVLTRILEAAHTAPSVGFSQPWDFLVIRDTAMRQSIHELAVRQRRAYAASLPKARAKAFAAMKVEAILETPVNIVVTCDPTRGGRHTLGRYTQPMMAPFSSCLAVENLWLAARAEGLGVGWVSFFDEPELAAVLDLPAHLQVVAYLCIGFVTQFPTEPELAGTGWATRRPLSWAVHEERFGHRALPGTEPLSLLSETIDAIRPLDPAAVGAARDRQARMTKPPGSLGVLEAVAEQLAGLAGVCPPPMPEPAAIAVFAGDHGVHAQGVTPWPQEVTAQMVGNFLAGGAVVNAFAKQVGAEVCVVDVGVAAQLPSGAGLVPRKVRFGTADMTQGPALTRAEVVEAVEAGIETARDLVAAGNRCLLTGDMGIANTTASAALIAAFTGASPAQVTGYGTGIDEQTYAHKVEVVHRALQLHRPDPQDPIGVLAAFGGLEHAALAGFILGAAALRIPVLLDGVIAGAAALVAQAFVPESVLACVAGHRSAEPGHALALEALGVVPLIDLELRLGEGSGAALALPLVGAAVRALREVATFDDAGVADASEHTAQPPTDRERG
jgi:nicotinate-nucleotide--dimethylbenzimidazole phosphoribosyltransferase